MSEYITVNTTHNAEYRIKKSDVLRIRPFSEIKGYLIVLKGNQNFVTVLDSFEKIKSEFPEQIWKKYQTIEDLKELFVAQTGKTFDSDLSLFYQFSTAYLLEEQIEILKGIEFNTSK